MRRKLIEEWKSLHFGARDPTRYRSGAASSVQGSGQPHICCRHSASPIPDLESNVIGRIHSSLPPNKRLEKAEIFFEEAFPLGGK